MKPLRQTARPVGTVLVIDTSGSMQSKGALQSAKAAARQFVAGRAPNEWMAVVSFSSAPVVRAGFTQDAAALGAAIDALAPVGETALWDALTTAAHLYDQRPDLQANLVLLSDGADSISTGDRRPRRWRRSRRPTPPSSPSGSPPTSSTPPASRAWSARPAARPAPAGTRPT